MVTRKKIIVSKSIYFLFLIYLFFPCTSNFLFNYNIDNLLLYIIFFLLNKYYAHEKYHIIKNI